MQASTSFSPESSENINNLLNLREKKLRYKHKRLKCLDDVVRRIDELFFIELFALYYLEYVDESFEFAPTGKHHNLLTFYSL